MTDKRTGKWELRRGINVTLCKREWAFLRKTGLSNILFTQGFPWKIKAFSHLPPPPKSKKTKTKKHFYAWNYWKSFSQTRIKSSSSNSVILPLVTKKNIANTSLLIRKKKKKKSNAGGRTGHVRLLEIHLYFTGNFKKILREFWLCLIFITYTEFNLT